MNVTCCINILPILSVCFIYKGTGKNIFLWLLWAQIIVHTYSNVRVFAVELKAAVIMMGRDIDPLIFPFTVTYLYSPVIPITPLPSVSVGALISLSRLFHRRGAVCPVELLLVCECRVCVHHGEPAPCCGG